MHYQEKLDNIFNNGNLWKHRTLRTIFDPYSSEYNDTNIDKKIKTLKIIKNNNVNFSKLIQEYKMFYKNENKPNVINSLEDGLTILLENSMK